jgi:HK97 family phage portal protein
MFITRIKAAADGDRSPWGSFWFEPVGSRSLSGMRVSSSSAMQLSAVYRSVAVLAESFAILPPVIYEQDGRKRTKITNHWLYKLLAKKPNRFQNGFAWREMMQGHLALRGNAYNRILSNGRGEITELIPISPDRIKIDIANDGNYRYVVTDNLGNQETLSRGEIFHLKGLAPDIYRGYNPIELARDAVGIGLAAQQFGARFFGNDARPGMWLEFPGQFKDAESRKSFQEQWQAAQSGGNRGKTAILDRGMKLHEMTVNNADAQFLETRKFNVEDIARLFGVPPHRIGHLDRSTNNNIEHQGLEFVIYTMTPWAERWEAAIESELMIEDEGLEIEFDFSRLLRGDAKARSTYIHNGVLDGWLTRNEGREIEGYDPLDGLDEPLRPLNMVPENTAWDEDAEEEQAEPDQPEETPPKPKRRPRP